MENNFTFSNLILHLCKVFKKSAFLATLLLLGALTTQAQLVSLSNGRLVYNTYANQGESNSVNKIPDFSNCGYKGGGAAIPTLPVIETVTWQSGDCRQKIQDAIDRVSARTPDANGYRGAVLIASGAYQVGGPLYIRASGVVLRGQGNGVNGTVLIATLASQHTLVTIQGSGSGYAEISGSRRSVTNSYVATGAKTLDVESTSGLSVNDNIVIQKTPNQAWIEAIEMDLGIDYNEKPPRDESWTPEKRRINWERNITRIIDGNTIEIDAPIVDAIQSRYGGADVYKPNLTSRITNCGVENIRMESNYASDTDEDHGWIAVEVRRAKDCWVKGVIAKYFGNTCVRFAQQSRHITVEDCAMIDHKSVVTGGNRYSFSIDDGSTGVLVQRCMTWGGRHDLVSGSNVPGPNAFVDCVIEASTADIGPHSSWATGQLYDAIYAGEMRVVNRMYSGSGHGWTGASILFWNTYSWELNVVVDNAASSRNWVIGGISENANRVGNGYFESWGTHVTPRSLYIQQLQDRLGSTAVSNVTTTEQRNNTLRGILRSRISQILAEPKVQPGPGSSIPAAPSNLVATANSATQITVTWNDNSTNEDKFYLQQSTDGTTFTGVTNPPANSDGTASYVVTGLTAGTRYWFRVRSENTAGKSAYSNIDDATTSSGTTYYKIKVVNNPTFVLNAASTTLTNGTNVNVYTSGTSTAQQWQLIDTDSGYKRIASRINTNYVLDCSTTPANSVNVQLWNWTGNTRQQWLLTDIGGGAYKITVRADALQGLDCSTTPANNVNVQMWNYVGNTRQQWILEPVSGGTATANQVASLSLDNQPSVSELQLQYLANSGSSDGKVSFHIPAAAQTTVEVFNLNGQKVVELLKGFTPSGNHLIDFNSNGLSKGMYVIKLTSGSQSKTVKAILN
jgi:hypothetical protein